MKQLLLFTASLFAFVALPAQSPSGEERYEVFGEPNKKNCILIKAIDTQSGDTILVNEIRMGDIAISLGGKKANRKRMVAVAESDTSLIKTISLAEFEKDMWAPPRQTDVIGYASAGNAVFVLLATNGVISLQEYSLDGNKVVGQHDYFVDHHHLISIANGGGVGYSANMKKVDGTLYMYINGGQLHGGMVNALYTFPLANAKDKQVERLDIDWYNPDKRVWVYYLSESGREYYDQEKEQIAMYEEDARNGEALSAEDKQYIRETKQWLREVEKNFDTPYFLQLVSNDEEKRDAQKNMVTDKNYESYDMFDDYESNRYIDTTKITDAQPILEQVFKVAGRSGKIRMFEYFPMSQGRVLFLCRLNNKLTCIAFDRHECEWHFLKYTIVKSEPRQLWFSAEED